MARIMVSKTIDGGSNPSTPAKKINHIRTLKKIRIFINMEIKICRTCKFEKPLEEFLWRNKTKNQKHSECKECYKITRKKSYNNNKKYYYEKNKRIRKQNILWYKELKSNLKCVLCSETEPCTLDFHHKEGEKKEQVVSLLARSTCSINTIKKEMEKCVVVCSNCHRKIHAGIIKL